MTKKLPCLTTGNRLQTRENKGDLARLLSEELCCQVADGDIVTAGGFESPETV